MEIIKKLEKIYKEILKFSITYANPIIEYIYISNNKAILIDWDLAEFSTANKVKENNRLDLRYMISIKGWHEHYFKKVKYIYPLLYNL
jgi:hypothetical protein